MLSEGNALWLSLLEGNVLCLFEGNALWQGKEENYRETIAQGGKVTYQPFCQTRK